MKSLLTLFSRPSTIQLPFRLFSSTPPPRKFFIPESYLTVNHSRSSGPGGQNVNKVNTKVELRFDMNSAHWLPEDVIQRLNE